MTLAPHPTPPAELPVALAPADLPTRRRARPGLYPWVMALAEAISVSGAALSLNGVLRGWAWYPAALTTVFVVALAMAALRSFRAPALLVSLGGLVTLAFILTFTFFRGYSAGGFLPGAKTLTELEKYLRRASETVLAESTPVASNAGIVLVICAALGLIVILVDALALPLGMPATSGLGLAAVLVIPAMMKPQSVGLLAFAVTVAGFLLILACSQWYAPDSRTRADTARNSGQLSRAVATGSIGLVTTLLLTLVIPGFDQGTFPQGSRLNLWSTGNGINPMISLGNNLRTPTGEGRITYATNATRPLYLRTVTVDRFDGDSWGPDDRNGARRFGVDRLETDHEVMADEQIEEVTAIDTGRLTSPYLPAPYAPNAIYGLTGRWSWDPTTLSIKGADASARNQQYVVFSSVPKLTPELLQQSSEPVRGISEEFTRPPGGVPEIVTTTANEVTADSPTPYAKAMAIQKYLRSGDFVYSLQSPVQGGYDGNGLSVLADFLEQKSGYCIHYASAMAVMARLEGIPSRIAVGYAPGRPTGSRVIVPGQGPLTEYEVDSRDAHAWPELYFQNVGWVAFEPTPSRGVVPDYALETSTSGSANTNEGSDNLLPSDVTPAPAPATTPLPLPGAESRAGDGAGSLLRVLTAVAGIFVLAVLAASPRLVRAGLRSRRLREPRRGQLQDQPAELVWAELQDLSRDYGVLTQASETPRIFAARLCRSALLQGPDGTTNRSDTDTAVRHDIEALMKDFERRRYGPPAAPPAGPGTTEAAAAGNTAAARISRIHAVMRANSSLLVQLRAEWLPPSVMGRWAQIMAAPLRAVGRAAEHAVRFPGRFWPSAFVGDGQRGSRTHRRQ